MANGEKTKGQPVKLTVTSCVVGYQGTNAKGDPYVIYEIAACRDTGEPITDKKLRSFEELPVGELLDLLVVPFESAKHGLSFTLSRKNKVGTHQRINELKGDVQALLARIEAIERWIAQQGGATTDGPPADAARQAELDDRFGAAPPY